MDTVTIFEWLHKSMIQLKNAGVDSPRRDCIVLIEDLLHKDRSWVNAHPEHKLTPEELSILDKQLKRRLKREPLAYIRGKAWFYGRFFAVSPKVLVPRPESESFIEILKKIKPRVIYDVGTGSGCLAITAALELPEAQVYAIDNDMNALEIAKSNAKKLKANVEFLCGDMFRPIQIMEDSAIVANLPYVPQGLITSPEITYEPKDALFSGKDGLDHYERFWQEIKDLPVRPRYILTESLESQHEELNNLASKSGYELTATEVLVQLFARA